jgi:hypothetical protein
MELLSVIMVTALTNFGQYKLGMIIVPNLIFNAGRMFQATLTVKQYLFEAQLLRIYTKVHCCFARQHCLFLSASASTKTFASDTEQIMNH